MAELVLRADLLEPEHVKTIKYSGPRTNDILKVAPNALKTVLKLTSTSLFEDKLKWDVSGGKTIDFYGSWRGKDGKDANTTIWCNIKAQGTIKEDGTGDLTIWLKGTMETKFKYSNPIMRGIIWMYKNLIYGEQLRRYAAKGKKDIGRMESDIKAYFDIGG